MAVRCLTGARFTMNAEVLRWSGITTPTEEDTSQGEWVTYQDPITGEIRNEWVPGDGSISDDPTTPADERLPVTIDCVARGIVDGGIRVAGTTERFGDDYENVDFVRLWTPAKVKLSKRDRITNIRAKKGGEVVWVDEEYGPVEGGGFRPTIFNVNGVTPQFDALNRHIENYVLLEKVDY